MLAKEYVRIEEVLMANQTCHSLEYDKYIAIRTTTVLLSHNGKERPVVIAMDPCSNLMNIDEDFAKEWVYTSKKKDWFEISTFSNLCNSSFRFGFFYLISAEQRKIIQNQSIYS